jgi:hypothetical protein
LERQDDPRPKAAGPWRSEVASQPARVVPNKLTELVVLGRALRKRPADIPACFDRPGSSNGPTEASNGRLERRSLLEPSISGFDYTPDCEERVNRLVDMSPD